MGLFIPVFSLEHHVMKIRLKTIKDNDVSHFVGFAVMFSIVLLSSTFHISYPAVL